MHGGYNKFKVVYTIPYNLVYKRNISQLSADMKI